MAVVDPSGAIAIPLPALARADEWSAVRAVVDAAGQEGAVRIVVGLPITPGGSYAHQAQKVLRFCEMLRSITELPVETWEGRFSSIDAEYRLRAAGMLPARDSARLDSNLAADILQTYLDAQPRERHRAKTVRA